MQFGLSVPRIFEEVRSIGPIDSLRGVEVTKSQGTIVGQFSVHILLYTLLALYLLMNVFPRRSHLKSWSGRYQG
jgi:hypothetical protein